MFHFIRSLLVFSLLFTAISCTPLNKTSGTHMTETDKFFLIPSGILSDVPPSDTKLFYISGRLEDGHFKPLGRLEGQGIFATSGMPGWYELGAKTFFEANSPKKPTSPYIEGFMTKSGFVPSSSRIY